MPMTFQRAAPRLVTGSVDEIQKAIKELAEWISQVETNARDVDDTLNQSYAQAKAATSLSLTTNYQDIPNVTITLGRVGTYLIAATVEFIYVAADQANEAQLVVGGTAQTEIMIFLPATNTTAAFSKVWIVTTTTPSAIVKMQAKKLGGAAASSTGVLSDISAVLLF